STGLTCCMLITLYVLNETSYDRYQKNADNIYQVGTDFIGIGNFKKQPNTPAAMGEIMKSVFPQIQQTARLVRLFAEDKTLVQYTPQNGAIKSFYETKGYVADSTFFRIFTHHFIEGNPATALTNPNSVVLAEEIAKKIFGNQPALNKVIHISSSTNGDHDYQVTGVFRPINKPSHIDGRFFMSTMGGNIASMIKNAGTNLANNNMYYTYLLLAPGTDPKKFEAQFPAFVDKYAGKDLKAVGFQKAQYLTALKDIHLHSGSDNDVTPSGSVTYLYILASIALFTLLIACINFMNLSTARSSKRSSEVGIRKVLGAEKKFLIAQFLGESILMSLIAFVFAIAFTKLLIPAFNHLSGKNLSLSFANIWIIVVFLLLSILTGLLAGSYPAFYLRSADLGFTQERQIVIPLRSQNAKKIYNAFKDELLKQSTVANVGASMFYPGITNFADNILYKEGESMQRGKDIRMNYVDTRFLQTLNIEPVAGRLFSDDFPSDTAQGIIVNQKAIKELGYASPQESIGNKLYFDF